MAVTKPMKLGLGLAAALAVAALGVAAAETAGSPLPAAVQKLLACRSATPDAARLACYDTAVGELSQLIATGEVVVVDHKHAHSLGASGLLGHRGSTLVGNDQAHLPRAGRALAKLDHAAARKRLERSES